jgi:hypothetical protein
MHIPARIARLPDDGQRAVLLDAAKAQAFDAEIFGEREPFFWAAHVSNDRVDAYFTHMLRSTLDNFAREAQAGVSFMQGHNVRQMPTGRSLSGALEEGDFGGGAKMRVRADFYTLANLKLDGGRNTNEFIDGVRSGLLSDVSVGFYGGRQTCDVCGRDWWDWDCRHIPGVVYEVKGDDGVVRERVATWSVDGSHLAEVSGVYDGATPDATILKTERMAGAGLLKPETARLLEQQFRIRLPGSHRAWAGYTPEKGSDMDAQAQLDSIRTNLVAGGYDGEDVPASVERLLTDLESAREAAEKAKAERVTLEAEAADGRQYRADMIAQALAEGVRANGASWNRATYEKAIATLPLDTIRTMSDDWKRQGDERFPPGRQTAEDAGRANGKAIAPVPDSAYRA